MKTGYDQFFKKAKQTAVTQTRAENIRTLKRQKASKNKKKFPVIQFTLFALLGVGAFFAIENLDQIEAQIKKIDITMTTAKAEEKVLPPDAKPVVPATPVAAKESEVVAAAAGSNVDKKPVDDADYLFKLAERKKVLDQREEDLNKLSAEIDRQKIEIEEKVKRIGETRSKISSVLEEKIKTDDAKVDTLVQMYSNMKPQQVAKVFETMDEDLVIEILSRMKKKSAADILNLVKPEKAQIFAERFAGYRTPANQ